jgi:hypothetical protein
MRLLFCLFADSIGLLPDHIFRQLVEMNRATPAKFTNRLRQLFAAMSTSGITSAFTIFTGSTADYLPMIPSLI